jgi:hypothetical protein
MADFNSKYTGEEVEELLDNIPKKQDNLVSGENIKTIGGVSILGKGNIELPTSSYVVMGKVLRTSAPVFNAYPANVVHEYQVSLTSLTIGSLTATDTSKENIWIIRFGCQSGLTLTVNPSVYWKDGVAPTFGSWGVCELTFKKESSLGVYLGEWKIYK